MSAQRQAFLEGLEGDGYRSTTVEFAPGTEFEDHTHNFASRVFILEGQLSITTDGSTANLGPGDVFDLMENQIHSEIVGPIGVRYLSGRPLES
jgi:quercetin dioxygenase-like cupin family protein